LDENWMKKYLLASTILVSFLAPAASLKAQPAPASIDSVTHQFPAIYTSLFQLNGHWWNAATTALKTGFVVGYAKHPNDVREGSSCPQPLPLDAPEAEEKARGDETRKCLVNGYPATLLVGEIVNRLDMFYQPAENLNLPIREALHVIGMQFAGKPQSEIESRLSTDRKFYDLLHKPPDPKLDRFIPVQGR